MTARHRPPTPTPPPNPLPGLHVVICNWRDGVHPLAGGAELYCERVARQFAAWGMRVTILTSRPPGAARHEQLYHAEIVRRGGTFTTYPLALWWLFRHRREIDGVIDSENGIPYFAPLAVGRFVSVLLLIHHVHQDQFEMYFPRSLATGWRDPARHGCTASAPYAWSHHLRGRRCARGSRSAARSHSRRWASTTR